MGWNKRLKELRGNRTIEEVCEKIGIFEPTYESYEKGTSMPLDPVKELIAKYYNVSVDYIWGNA